VLGILWMIGVSLWSWSQHQYYVGEQDGVVTIFRGVQADVPGVSLSHAYETTNVQVSNLDPYTARSVEQGIGAGSLDDAQRTVARLAANQQTSGGG
jgi:protein phosphatase